MNSSGIDVDLSVICKTMKLYSFVFTNNQTKGVVYRENNKGPKREPWGTPNRSLQRPEGVEPIFSD